MKTALTNTSKVDATVLDTSNTIVELQDIIAEYKAIDIKLSLFADAVPETRDEQQDLIEKEVLLLDKQAGLLETALSSPVESLEDAKAVMTLWHSEIVQGQSPDSLSASDELVNSVFEFLKTA